MTQKLKDLIWGIEYGCYAAIYSFKVWSAIMGSHYDESFYKGYTQQEIEEDYLYYFWVSLDDGIE
jgi:hypothetical protein